MRECNVVEVYRGERCSNYNASSVFASLRNSNCGRCFLWPVGGAAAPVPATGWVAAHLCQLDSQRWGLEGLPGWEDEGTRGGTGGLAPNQTRGSPHSGTGAGETDAWMDGWFIGEWSMDKHTQRNQESYFKEPPLAFHTWRGRNLMVFILTLGCFISETTTLQNGYEMRHYPSLVSEEQPEAHPAAPLSLHKRQKHWWSTT